MRDEGYVTIDTRRYGRLAWLRNKQWWYFEGLDPAKKLYFVFLALEALPTSYVSIKVIDYEHNRRWTEDHLGSFQAAPGQAVNVSAAGKWGRLRFEGSGEQGWRIAVQTEHVEAELEQTAQAGAHRDWLLTQHIDYTIQQFVMNRTCGKLRFEGQEMAFDGYGYHEHNWGVQPRHSTAHWLHFWTPASAGVVLSCHYDAGLAHHYSFIWQDGQEHVLYSPAQFSFDPAHPESVWQAVGPDLHLTCTPRATHHTRMRIPPWPAYVDVDYTEQVLDVHGTAMIQGQPTAIDGVGKLDFNWNRW